MPPHFKPFLNMCELNCLNESIFKESPSTNFVLHASHIRFLGWQRSRFYTTQYVRMEIELIQENTECPSL